MKKLSLCIALLLLTHLTMNAQNIKGKIIDQENNPIEFATIVLQTTDSIFINTTYSDSLGCFFFKNSAEDAVLLVQHLMYEPYHEKLDSKENILISLQEKNQSLAEVTITAERPLVRVEDGKMIYDMPQILQNKMANNAYEALLELPGLYEQEDALNLAGANGVTVILNGKATTMTTEQLTTLLKNMPKERLQQAEIMYSAPPQYHVRGSAINLVLAGSISDSPQLQGQVNGTYNQNHYASYQTGVNLMYSTPKTSTDFLYSFDYGHGVNGQDLYSHHLFEGKVHEVTQLNKGYRRSPSHNIRLANDWHLNKDNKLSLIYTSAIEQWSHSFTESSGTNSNSKNRKNTVKPAQLHNLELNYSSGFGLSIGVNYTYYDNNTEQNYEEKLIGKEDAFKANSKQRIHRVTFFADQSHTLGKGWKLNYGTKLSYASDKSSQIYHSLRGKDLSPSNSGSQLDEYTYDLYAGFSKSISSQLSLNASLMGEYYKHKEIDYWSVFPTLEATFIANPTNMIQLSVSSDKTYPSYWEMQNSIGYINGYTEIHGNPNLKPLSEYEVQLNYILKQKYIFGIAGSYIKDNFNQLPYQLSDRLALIYKTQNFDYKSKLSAHIILPFRMGEVLDSRLMLVGFYDKVKSDIFYDTSFKNDKLVGYASLNNTFKISSKPNIKAELSGAYMTPNIQGPMSISKLYKVDMGMKWVSDNKNTEVNIKLNDIFNTWSPKYLKVNDNGQNLKMNLLQDSRRFSIGLTHKFGGYKENKYKELDTSRFGTK